MNNGQPIGVFDSGVGGLSILMELQELLPREDFIFLADQAHFPYGKRSRSQLCELTYSIADFFIQKKTKLIVIACNTATCHTIDFLRDNFDIPFVGTVPAIKPAAEATIRKSIGVISTPATSKSNYIADLIDSYARGIKTVSVSCAGLENAVEKGDIDSPNVKSILKKCLEPIKKSGADIIVLGCTHYPFLRLEIEKILGKDIKIIDSGKAVAKQTACLLEKYASLNDRGGRSIYFTTSDPKKFSEVASTLMNKKITAGRIAL